MHTRLVAVATAAFLATTMTACSSEEDDSADTSLSKISQGSEVEHFPDACTALENALGGYSDYSGASDDDAKDAVVHQRFDPTLEYLDGYNADIQQLILRAYTIRDMPMDGQVVQPGDGVPGTMPFVFSDLDQAYEDTCP